MHSVISSGLKSWNIVWVICGAKISARMTPTLSTRVITVMMTEKVSCASASRFSASNQIGEEIGDLKCGDVGVGGRAGAECPGGIGFANIACNTRENDGEHDQDGRGKGCVLVRGPEQLRDAREGALRLARLR